MVIVLAQLDKRYFYFLESYCNFSLQFNIYEKGENEPVASSTHHGLWDRSVNVETDLKAGEYVVQASIAHMIILPSMLTGARQVRVDRTTAREGDEIPALAKISGTRKYALKHAEMLRSHSIAAST